MAKNSKENLVLDGIKVDSENEYFVGLALQKLGLEYEYQKYFGTPGTRGGQIIDFLVYVAPLPIPLFVHGRWWHEGQMGREDQFKMAMLESATRGKWAKPVIIWGEESDTEESALQAVREKLL